MGLKRENDEICNKFLDPVSKDDTIDESAPNESDMETDQRGVRYNLLQSNDEDESDTDYISNMEEEESDDDDYTSRAIRESIIRRNQANLNRTSNILETDEARQARESREEREEREGREFVMNMPAILESMSRVTQHLNDLAAAAIRRHNN